MPAHVEIQAAQAPGAPDHLDRGKSGRVCSIQADRPAIAVLVIRPSDQTLIVSLQPGTGTKQKAAGAANSRATREVLSRRALPKLRRAGALRRRLAAVCDWIRSEQNCISRAAMCD